MDNLLLYKSTKVRIKNLSKKLKSKMIIFIFLVMCIERALSDNSLTLDALEQKAFDELVMAIMYDESIFYSFMLRSAISRDSLDLFQFRWLKISLNAVESLAPNPMMFNHLK